MFGHFSFCFKDLKVSREKASESVERPNSYRNMQITAKWIKRGFASHLGLSLPRIHRSLKLLPLLERATKNIDRSACKSAKTCENHRKPKRRILKHGLLPKHKIPRIQDTKNVCCCLLFFCKKFRSLMSQYLAAPGLYLGGRFTVARLQPFAQ